VLQRLPKLTCIKFSRADTRYFFLDFTLWFKPQKNPGNRGESLLVLNAASERQAKVLDTAVRAVDEMVFIEVAS